MIVAWPLACHDGWPGASVPALIVAAPEGEKVSEVGIQNRRMGNEAERAADAGKPGMILIGL